MEVVRVERDSVEGIRREAEAGRAQHLRAAKGF